MKLKMKQEEQEFIKQRYLLAKERLKTIEEENVIATPYMDFFAKTSSYLLFLCNRYEEIKDIHEKGSFMYELANIEELKKMNHSLYQDILVANYEKSYGNPQYAVSVLGQQWGQVLGALYAELRTLVTLIHEEDIYFITIRLELFLEMYHSFYFNYLEEKEAPDVESGKQILYWFVYDYCGEEIENRVLELIDPDQDFATKIIRGANLKNPGYLYEFGEYITDNEIETSIFFAKLPQETIEKMAETYTEGYRKGFILGNKDITKKKVVNIRYTLGFERMVLQAIHNFESMGLKPTIYRNTTSIFHKNGIRRVGYHGAVYNKQYDYDHKDDKALFIDKRYINHRLEVLKNAYEKHKNQAELFAGPAVIEVFGEPPFAPSTKEEACHLTSSMEKLSVSYNNKAGEIFNQYTRGDEKSFTIIAFPSPAIGEKFPEIFQEVIRINTLNADLYANIQSTIIKTLDQADFVEVLGMGVNQTKLKVKLINLDNPEKQTIFENCVADVNIPVGEVFTTPVLEGTNGLLHVSEVFLDGLPYKDLKITFQDGMIVDYDCSNFLNAEDNKKYIQDNILFHHKTLPLGEFAIGTNTTAYAVSRKYNLADKMPILIAEKMGPHFAVGDTCYIYSEDIAVYNPDGKEIVARDNTISLLRKEDSQKAYFNCHTDITIPYDELGELTAVTKNGEQRFIIQQGRFVLPGCEELNFALMENS